MKAHAITVYCKPKLQLLNRYCNHVATCLLSLRRMQLILEEVRAHFYLSFSFLPQKEKSLSSPAVSCVGWLRSVVLCDVIKCRLLFRICKITAVVEAEICWYSDGTIVWYDTMFSRVFVSIVSFFIAKEMYTCSPIYYTVYVHRLLYFTPLSLHQFSVPFLVYIFYYWTQFFYSWSDIE